MACSSGDMAKIWHQHVKNDIIGESESKSGEAAKIGVFCVLCYDHIVRACVAPLMSRERHRSAASKAAWLAKKYRV